MSQPQADDIFAFLHGQYMGLTTYRRSGQLVLTPVWFVEENGRVYVSTTTRTGKVKRIRRNPKVELAPCTFHGEVVGPTVKGVGRILPADEEAVAKGALRRKYGWQVWLALLISKLRGEKRIYLEIRPAEDAQ